MISSARSRVPAPIAGQINQRKAMPGDHVKEETVIATIADLSRLRLVGSVPERAAPMVRELKNQREAARSAWRALNGSLLAGPAPWAGLAGVALSQIDNVSPNLGQGYIIDSFMIVIFGGVGNLWGTLVGAFTLGIVNKFLEPYAGAVLGKILVLAFIILFIQARPRGMFALKGRAVES